MYLNHTCWIVVFNNFVCIPHDAPTIITVIAVSTIIDEVNGPTEVDKNEPRNIRTANIAIVPITIVIIIQTLFLATKVFYLILIKI
jgi:hypothetical protein